MKIIYGVCGEGRGHSTRSRPIIQHLQNNNEVVVFAGAKALQCLKTHFPVKRITSMRMVFSKNKVNTFRTIIFNVFLLPFYSFSLMKVFLNIFLIKPDLIITDFEPWTAWAGNICRIPVLSIQLPGHYLPPQPFWKNNLSAPSTIPRTKNRDYWNFFKLWAVTSFTIPRADAVIIPSFFRVDVNDNCAKFITPIIRKEIMQKKPTKCEHILIYQSPGTDKETIELLQQFPSQKFVVYGFSKEGIQSNIIFKKINEDYFFNDLASAKGIITNAGISLMTEAIFLKKPLLAIPIHGQSEQIVNAYFLQKQKFGITANKLSYDLLEKFIKQANKSMPKQVRNWDVEKSLKEIENVLFRLAKIKGI